MRDKHSPTNPTDKTLVGSLAGLPTGMSRVTTVLSLLVISLVMGVLIGLFVQVMLQLMNFCIELLWDVGGGLDVRPWLPLVICPVGGLIIGVWNARFHAAPASLEEVMQTVKKTGTYRVGKVPAAIVAFLLPLAFGGSIGPEAGLTGFIAGAATRISATLRRAGLRAASLADVTVSATICAVFGAPFAGFVASTEHMPHEETTSNEQRRTSASTNTVSSRTESSNNAYTPEGHSEQHAEQHTTDELDETRVTYRRGVKVVLYGLSAAGAFLGMWLASFVVGRSGGLPRFEGFSNMPLTDGLWIFVCIAAGYALTLVFGASTKASAALKNKLGAHDLIKGLLAGIVLGILGTMLPYVLFSGEEQGREIVEVWQSIPALVLVITAFVKAATTPFCIEMGWRGGTIFPCIFAGVALGLGMAVLVGANPMFCATCTCAAFMGAKMRKPVLAAALLLLCFPPASILWMVLAAAAGALIPQPKALRDA